MSNGKKLKKSSADKIFAGVCGGIGEYFNIDSAIIRIIWAIATLFYGTGLIIYIIFALCLPKDDQIEKVNIRRNKKKFQKSSSDKVFAGVCGGIAEYFNINSFWIRLIWFLICWFKGIGILIYLVFALIMPEEQ